MAEEHLHSEEDPLRVLLQAIHRGFHIQQSMNKQLHDLANNPIVFNAVGGMEIKPHHPYQFYDINQSLPFTTLPTVSFHVAITTAPSNICWSI